MTLQGESIYHMPIENLPLNQDGIPPFLPSVCHYICDFSESIGLFRQCGQHLLIQDLGILFRLPKSVMPPSATVYDAAAFLKKWLRELPVPLLTPSVVNRVFDSQNPDSVRSVLRQLSPVARKTFVWVCLVIRSIVSKSEVNQMGFRNIAFCFFDNITQSSKDLEVSFNFRFFYANALIILNSSETDFDLDHPITAEMAFTADKLESPAEGTASA
jgi:hypothetical protein